MSNRQAPGAGPDPRLILLAVGAVSWIGANLIAWVAFSLAGTTNGNGSGVNPLIAIPRIATDDQLVWTPAAAVVAVIAGVALLGQHA